MASKIKTTSKMRMTLKIEDDLKNKDGLKLKKEDYLGSKGNSILNCSSG